MNARWLPVLAAAAIWACSDSSPGPATPARDAGADRSSHDAAKDVVTDDDADAPGFADAKSDAGEDAGCAAPSYTTPLGSFGSSGPCTPNADGGISTASPS